MSADTKFYVTILRPPVAEEIIIYAVDKQTAMEEAEKLPAVLHAVDVKHWSEVEGNAYDDE